MAQTKQPTLPFGSSSSARARYEAARSTTTMICIQCGPDMLSKVAPRQDDDGVWWVALCCKKCPAWTVIGGRYETENAAAAACDALDR